MCLRAHLVLLAWLLCAWLRVARGDSIQPVIVTDVDSLRNASAGAARHILLSAHIGNGATWPENYVHIVLSSATKSFLGYCLDEVPTGLVAPHHTNPQCVFRAPAPVLEVQQDSTAPSKILISRIYLLLSHIPPDRGGQMLVHTLGLLWLTDSVIDGAGVSGAVAAQSGDETTLIVLEGSGAQVPMKSYFRDVRFHSFSVETSSPVISTEWCQVSILRCNVTGVRSSGDVSAGFVRMLVNRAIQNVRGGVWIQDVDIHVLGANAAAAAAATRVRVNSGSGVTVYSNVDGLKIVNTRPRTPTVLDPLPPGGDGFSGMAFLTEDQLDLRLIRQELSDGFVPLPPPATLGPSQETFVPTVVRRMRAERPVVPPPPARQAPLPARPIIGVAISAAIGTVVIAVFTGLLLVRMRRSRTQQQGTSGVCSDSCAVHQEAENVAGGSSTVSAPHSRHGSVLDRLNTVPGVSPDSLVAGCSPHHGDGRGEMERIVSDLDGFEVEEGQHLSVLEEVQRQMDHMHSCGLMLLRRYLVLGPMHRRLGGQGIIQFARRTQDGTDVVVKFYFRAADFQHEERLLMNPAVQAVAPHVLHASNISDRRVPGADRPVGPNAKGLLLPPFVVMERGEVLSEWLARAQPDQATCVFVVCHVAMRLQVLHNAGLVHGDVKPGNIVWLPRTNSWRLVDFGCTLETGTSMPVVQSFGYCPPEMSAAMATERKTFIASDKLDVWALGTVAYEVFTGTSAMENWMPHTERQQLPPWTRNPASSKKLGALKHIVLQCLNPDPVARPSAGAVVQEFHRAFQFQDVQGPTDLSASATEQRAAYMTERTAVVHEHVTGSGTDNVDRD